MVNLLKYAGLVGSNAKALVLVLGETATGGFVPPRPFRVNAGPVHSYILRADGKTSYLSEVKAGDELLVASRAGGSTRSAVVGRAKVEPRPCLRVDHYALNCARSTANAASKTVGVVASLSRRWRLGFASRQTRPQLRRLLWHLRTVLPLCLPRFPTLQRWWLTHRPRRYRAPTSHLTWRGLHNFRGRRQVGSLI